MKAFLAAWVFLALSMHGVASAAGAGVRGLMDEPASLFDLGMQRLPPNIDMFDGFYRAGSENREARLDLNWRYDRNANQIVGSLSVLDVASDRSAMKAGCSEALKQLKIWVGKSLPKIFMHHGWDWDDHTEETRRLDAELREMFTLTCTVYGQSSEEQRFHGRATFREKGMIYE